MRNAIAGPSGHVEQTVRVRGYHWRCLCRPEDGHDHAAQHKKLERGLEKRDAVVDSLNSLVGESGRLGLLSYTITDSNIQIHGPEKWVLYVAWEETSPTGTAFRHWSLPMSDLDQCPAAPQVLSTIQGMVTANGNLMAAAIRAAGDFNSGVA